MKKFIFYQFLMESSEMYRRLRGGEDGLDISIDKWKRARDSRNWGDLIKRGACKKYLYADTCPLCQLHWHNFKDGPIKGHTCLGDTGELPCPLVEKSDGNVTGCTCVGNSWDKARTAVELRDRAAFMKASRGLLERLKRARNWYVAPLYEK